MAPHSYAASRPEVRTTILERLAAGERLKHICAEPGMPCHESVTGWMRKDAGFAAEVARARAQGEFRRRLVFDEAKAKALLARLAAGEAIASVLRDPAMPSAGTFRYWRATYGAFAEEVHRLNQVKTDAKRERLRGRYRPFDPEVAERLYVRLWKGDHLRAVLRSDKAFPSLAVLTRWRRENPEFDGRMRFVLTGWKKKRGRERCLCTPELTATIVDRLRQGESLRSLSQQADMPSQGAMYNWVRTRPEFARAVAAACEDREDWYRDQMLDLVIRAAPMSERALTRLTAPLSRQETRLRKRPGWKRAREGASSPPGRSPRGRG